MWEKAFIGDDGSQFRRKRSVRPCGLNSKGLSLCLFELNYKQDVRQKDRSQEWFHSVKSFCFSWIPNHSHCEWFLQSLLDILESRVMKRMSINHCVEVDADNYWKGTRKLQARVQLHKMWVFALKKTIRLQTELSIYLIVFYFTKYTEINWLTIVK